LLAVTAVGFLIRSLVWNNGQGIKYRRVLSDDGSAYKSQGWQKVALAK